MSNGKQNKMSNTKQNKMEFKLNIAQVSNRGNKFAIVAGQAILAKFKTIELAKAALIKNESFYKYWAGSVSVSVQNSKKITIIC